MKYQVLNHEYLNTGGNCMVSIFNVWLEDERRTLAALVNEEGGTLAAVDYVSHDVDYDESMDLQTFTVDDLTTGNHYFELFKYCWMEYVKKDCKYFKTTYHIPLILLNNDLLATITRHYYNWHIENVGDRFESDGYTIYKEDGYKPLPTLDINTEYALRNFKNAFRQLNKQYNAMQFEYLSDKYPFDCQFEELVDNVSEWCDDLLFHAPVYADSVQTPETAKAVAMLQYMDAEMDKWSDVDDEALMDAFYNLPFSITFGKQTFTAENSAAVYNALELFLKEFIGEQ